MKKVAQIALPVWAGVSMVAFIVCGIGYTHAYLTIPDVFERLAVMTWWYGRITLAFASLLLCFATFQLVGRRLYSSHSEKGKHGCSTSET